MRILEVLAWVAGLFGFGLLVAGVALISVPVALIVAGVMLMAWSWLADKAAAGVVPAKPDPDGG